MVPTGHARRRFAERYPDIDFDTFLSLAPSAVVIARDGELRTRDFRHVTVGLSSVWFVAEGERIVTVLTGTQAEGALYHKGVGWTLRPTAWTRAGGPQF
jgi:hypothetical protein